VSDRVRLADAGVRISDEQHPVWMGGTYRRETGMSWARTVMDSLTLVDEDEPAVHGTRRG